MALLIPNSASDNTDKMLENRPLTPRYYAESTLTKTIRQTKPMMVFMAYPATPVNILIREYSVRLRSFMFYF